MAGGRTRNLRVVQGCTIAVAQSRRKDAPTQTTAIRQPRPTFTTTNRYNPAFCGAGGRTRTVRVVQGCTMAVAQSRRKDAPTPTTAKARMPYKMNAQSFKQGCLKSATQSRYARMHKDSHTEPLHDATAQMAVIAQMQRHKWLSMHRCNDPNDRKRKDA